MQIVLSFGHEFRILVIPIAKQDRYNTGFVTQHEHWQWVRMPLKKAATIFQRILSSIISKPSLSEFVINYLDDTLIFSNTFDKHMKHIERLAQAILKEGFQLKLTKR